MRTDFNRFSLHYLIIGGTVCVIAVTVMLIVRLGQNAASATSKALLALSVAHLIAGIAATIYGLHRRLKITEVVDAAEPLAEEKDPNTGTTAEVSAVRKHTYTAAQLREMLDVQRPLLI